eukprot:CAMPEP_0194580102 /NCGR_PEP_ID=MMETSP0292-20121207/13981_1 /TAXON_ID=39354 /ORGANISM="Heterosigma akashiwo, Strain CCMP2393" /LENGTH=266 /DNA_ID=CAMNT_0039433343 /DNA_START=46 /DNA_END=846 /DNA_ORIENTATION=+
MAFQFRAIATKLTPLATPSKIFHRQFRLLSTNALKYDASLKYDAFYNPKEEPLPIIVASKRSEKEKGTKYSVKKRQEGILPTVIYGKASEDACTQTRILANVSTRLIEQQLRRFGNSFEATLYDLEIDGAVHKVVPRQLALDPVKMPLDIVACNFLIYRPGVTRIPVPFEFVGMEDSTALKRGALLLPMADFVVVTCTDFAVPQKIQVDVSAAFVGQKIRISDVALPPNVEVAAQRRGEPDLLLAVVQGKKSLNDPAAGQEGVGDA